MRPLCISSKHLAMIMMRFLGFVVSKLQIVLYRCLMGSFFIDRGGFASSWILVKGVWF